MYTTLAHIAHIINPQRMPEGYSSRLWLSVCVSVTTIAAPAAI